MPPIFKLNSTIRMKNPVLHLRGLVTLTLLLVAAAIVPTSRAVIQEPDNLVWGEIVLGTDVVTAEQTSIVVEARRSLSDAPIASYRMGSNPAAGGFYSLAIPLESISPVTSSIAATTGEELLILVHNGEFVRYLTVYTVGTRGEITRLDLGDVDADGNGLVDNWERQHFGAAGQDADGDPDQDGVGNRNEMLAGTNPRFPDARHPADTNPTNNIISVHEVTAYASAWKAGKAWPVEPSDIPVDYVARAGFLWKNGEQYLLDTNSITQGAPLWWTNTPPAVIEVDPALAVASSDLSRSVVRKSLGAPEIGVRATPSETSRITRSLSETESGEAELLVTLSVSPAEMVTVYVVEESIPDGRAAGEISDDGSFDSDSSKLRWGPFFDHESRDLSYTLLSGNVPGPVAFFEGVASFDGFNAEIDGPNAWGEPVPMRWETPSITLDGSLILEFKGEPGKGYVIEVSTDLVDWTDVTQVTADAEGTLRDTEPIEPSRRQQFFRARQLDE